jgi:hypothetical protein
MVGVLSRRNVFSWSDQTLYGPQPRFLAMDGPSLIEQIRVLLASRSPVEGPVLGGTGFFIEGRMVVAVIDGRLCMPDDDSRPVSASPLFFARRAVPGWIALDAGELDAVAVVSWVERALTRIASSPG